MRVISGLHRGRVLRAPHGRWMRPTQGRVRQVLFDIVGEAIVGRRVLDLYAGVGAIGIEALSRGAAEACFVERDPAAIACLRENLEALELIDHGRVLGVAVEAGIRILASDSRGFDWIFADPPYDRPAAPWIRRAIRVGPGGLLARDGVFVLESSARGADLAVIGGLRRTRSRRVGETQLGFYQWGVRDDAEGDLSGDL